MTWTRTIAVFVSVFSLSLAAHTCLKKTCDSKVFCYGKLLETVQLAQVFNDSKSFVDLKLKSDVPTTLNNFDNFMSNTNNNPTKEQILEFVNANFEEGQELEVWNPPDYKPDPKFLCKIADADTKKFAKDLVDLWPKLGRKVRDDVAANPDQYSLIHVKNGLIVPGGRFREFYYWDSYWIIKGLLISEMYDTARGMIENFLSMVDRFGFVPNGGRVYYIRRSQPPLLVPMTKQLIDHTNDLAWLENNIVHLDEELTFWLNRRTVKVDLNGHTYTLAHYNAPSSGPRPESYREDFITASKIKKTRDQQEIYIDLKSAAESGWDFTSRWFFDENGGNNANLTSIQTRRVAPVDLNAYLCGAFKDLATLYKKLNREVDAQFWQKQYNNWQDAIKATLWSEEDGIWYDFDLELKKRRVYYSASNAAPLWTQCFPASEAPIYGSKVTNYLKTKQATEYPGGIPTTLGETGEQWDYPNCWPPLQAIVVQGLEMSGDPDAKVLAESLAKKWVSANLVGFTKTGEMFEKYDAETPGGYGGGGEYVVQSGFGWSNGVILEFINKYYATAKDCVRK